MSALAAALHGIHRGDQRLNRRARRVLAKLGDKLETHAHLKPVLAFYTIVARSVLYLTMLGRDCPKMPCDAVFADAECNTVYLVTQRKPPPEGTPSLDSMVRVIATPGGFFNRKGDGFPGPKTLWIGLQRIPDLVLAIESTRSVGGSCG